MASDGEESPTDVELEELTQEDVRTNDSNIFRKTPPRMGMKSGDWSFGTPGRDWKISGLSPLQDDGAKYRLENNQLRLQVQQLTSDLQSEQETVSQVRRRLNAVERERLEAATNSNIETASFESQLARLRSQLEKGEAARQSLEFELAKSKRENVQLRQGAMNKEDDLAKINSKLTNDLSDLTSEISRQEQLVQSSKRMFEEAERKLKKSLEEKDHELSKSETEQEIVSAERDKLDAVVLQQESALTDLNEKIADLETDRKNQTENLRRVLTDLEYGKEREDRLKKDLESALTRLRTLEESIEAERAAHLETKFNSEIIQLRVRDLEGALEVEKSANNEANKAIDRLTKQIRELEVAYEDERRNGTELSEKLEKVEKEYALVKKQLTSEVENKKNIIGNLSKELEVHQKNFNELKDELSKAKKRQIYLEETYGGSMRELELLLQNFQVEDKAKKTKGKKEGGKPTPSMVLESLRFTLAEYKKRLETTSQESTKMKKLSDGLTKEVDQCKEMIWAKDKALEEAQKNYTRTAKELNRVRSEFGGLEGTLTKLKVDLKNNTSTQSKDKTRIQELSEEIMKLVKRQKAENEEKLAFLHGMYQRLLAGRVMVSLKEKGFHHFSWSEMTSMVYEQVQTLVTTAQRAEEQLKRLEEALKAKDAAMEDMQASHEDQLNKLTSLTKERELSWQKQKEEIEGHYSQLLSDLQNRSKKSQTMADQAWEKMRMTGSVKQGLEAECLELRNKVVEYQKQIAALLAACGLMCGAFYPLCSRSNQLSLQRQLLDDQLGNWDQCREHIELLVDTLGSEMKTSKEEVDGKVMRKVKKSPLLRFRVGAVAVMAANRLQYLGRNCSKMFATYDTVTGLNSLLVCSGGVKTAPTPFPGRSSGERDHVEVEQSPGEGATLPWLTSTELLQTVVSSMAEILEVADQVKNKDRAGPVETRALVNAARSSFVKLLDRLGRYYEGISLQPVTNLRERGSLIRMLGRGLNKCLVGKSILFKQGLSSPQDLMVELQNQILEFTQRLHTVEVERRRLLMEVNRLKEETQNLDADGPDGRDGKILPVEENPDVVPMDKFESVCQELNNALRREQQAQQLLNEQGRQLEELTLRLDLYTTEGMEKEHVLTEAVQSLADTKLESRRKEQTMKQLNKQVHHLESEKKSFQSNLADAEKALRTVARDKEILAGYIKSVERALEQAKQEMSLAKGKGGGEMSLSRLLLNTEFIPPDIGKAGPELIASQNLVGAFVDCQHQAFSKITALEDEIETHKRHVNLLKKELNDAVRRDCDQQPELESGGFHGNRNGEVIPSVSEQDILADKDGFFPLREDSEISFVAPRQASSRTRIPGSPSPRKLDRSPHYQTPVRSLKSHSRPKSYEPGGR